MLSTLPLLRRRPIIIAVAGFCLGAPLLLILLSVSEERKQTNAHLRKKEEVGHFTRVVGWSPEATQDCVGVSDQDDYGVFTAGMRIQHTLGIPKYPRSQNDSRLDHERTWKFTKQYGQVVWDAVRPNLSVLTLNDESKRFLPFALPNADCLIVTIGVGMDITAEKFLKTLYPQCRFLGADPDAGRNRELFKSLGGGANFVQAALHAQAGKHEGHFLRGSDDNNKDFHYAKDSMEHVGMEEFFRQHLGGETIIDLLNVDAEGSEYSMLGWLTGRRPTDLPIICQLNVEVHHPPETFGGDYSTFFANLTELMKSYALLHTGPPEHPYMLAHFVNVGARKCLSKFAPA